MREQRALLSAKSDLVKAINYGLTRWRAFTRFLDDGCVCLSNNAAERAVRGIAVGRRNWTFAGSDEGGSRAASVYSLIESCKLNDVDPQAWLADVLARLPLMTRSDANRSLLAKFPAKQGKYSELGRKWPTPTHKAA